MAIEVTCRCGQRFATAEQYAGQTLQCPECGGNGQTCQWISQAEWQHIQRRRLVRGLVLLAASLLLIFTLVWAVSSREPDYACGSWWYGLIFVWLIIGRR